MAEPYSRRMSRLAWLGERGRDGGVDTMPLPGRPVSLSMCGKHAIGPDPDAAIARCATASPDTPVTVVCLVEEHEIAERYPDYLTWLRQRCAEGTAVWRPIHDLHAPDLDDARTLLDDLVGRIDRGEHLLLHCAAGIGRTGTIAACVLVMLGMDTDEALTHVAAHRPMAGPEAGSQIGLLRMIAALR